MEFDLSYIKDSKNLILNKISYLQNLCNKYEDFKIANSYKENEEIKWSKHRTVIECWENEKLLHFLEEATHRSQLQKEVVLDIDEKINDELLEKIYNNLKFYNLNFAIFSTGSKGFHIHIEIPNNNFFTSENFRRNFIYSFKKEFADELKYSSNVMVALEFTPHWKSGKIKKVIMSYPHGWWFI